MAARAPRLTESFQTALAIDRAVRRRAADEAISVPSGLVLRHAALRDVHYLNAVMLDGHPAMGLRADAVVALAERWLGERGHRHVVFDDAAGGERVGGELAVRGWERRRTTFMVFGGDAGAVGRDPRVRELSEVELRTCQLAGMQAERPDAEARSGLLRRLVATQTALRAATPAVAFGAGEGHEPQSSCTLFLDADVHGRRVAMIDEVRTLPAHRQRGLARAVVSAAIRTAAAWGAELTVVPADADDWPQLMYARLGFAPAGQQVSLTRRGQAAPRAGHTRPSAV